VAEAFWSSGWSWGRPVVANCSMSCLLSVRGTACEKTGGGVE